MHRSTPPPEFVEDLNAWLADFGRALGRALGASVAAGFREALEQQLPEGRAGGSRKVALVSPEPPKPAARKGGRRRTQADRCAIPGCNNPPRAKGLCGKHYQASRLERSRATLPVEASRPEPLPVPPKVRKKDDREPAQAS